MTADLRALDAEVAERIFGFKWMVVPSSGNRTLLHPRQAESAKKEFRTPWRDAIGNEPISRMFNGPEYSRNPAACELVKQSLRKARIQYAIVFHDDGTVGISRPGPQLMTGEGISCPTEAEAICRFALACHAVGLLQGAGK